MTGGRWKAFVLTIAVAIAAALALPRGAAAQSAPQISVQLDEDTVGVGDVVDVQMTATSADGRPADARLAASPGFSVRGQNPSPSETHISINGVRTDRYTLTVDWALQAERVGTFMIGPFSVAIGNARYSSQTVKVRVVPAGQVPPRRSRQSPAMQTPFGFSPFDPWKALIPGFNGFNGLNPAPSQVPPVQTIDPKLSLDAPRGNVYFLHATVDKTSAVVGEQVTLSVYEYHDIGAGDPAIDEEGAHEPRVADFVKHSLLNGDQDAVLAGYGASGGRTWAVALVLRWALFPLRTGDLVIGPMTETLARPRSVAGQVRATETLQVHVTEPPLAGRPPGYAVGNVGHYALSAQVQPREIEQDSALGVHVELSGTGNLPSTIDTGAREGVEWLTPEVHDEVGPIGHDAYGGKRSFDFVVRVKKPGNIDLGSLNLPFWNPDQKVYEVARAPLGSVHVKASPSAASPVAQEPQQLLPGLPAPRDVLQGASGPRRYIDDAPLFWFAGLAGWPLALGLAVGGRALARRVAHARASRRESPEANLKKTMAMARLACNGDDPRRADAAIARALEAASVAHAGVTLRAAVGGEVAEKLEGAGVARETATRVAELLRECEAARFSPDTSDVIAARDRWARAQGAIRSLEKRG